MKKLIWICLYCFMPFFFGQSMAQKLSLKEVIQLFELNDTAKIDKQLGEKSWYYMSSEVENDDQVDVWMSEKASGHVIQAMFVLVSNKKNTSAAHNQATYHILNAQTFADLQEEASEANFAFLKEEKKSENTQSEFFHNGKILLIFTIDRESQLPYKMMVANLKKK